MTSQNNKDKTGNIVGDLRVLSDKCNRDVDRKYPFNYEYYLKELEEAGFYVFGAREVQMIEGGKDAPSEWPVAFIRVIRKTNPEIISLSNKDERRIHYQQTDQQDT